MEKEVVLKLSISDSIEVKPDKAILNISIDSEKDGDTFIDNSKAISTGESTVSKALRIIRAFDIEDENVNTTNLNITTKYNYIEKSKQTGGIFGKDIERTSERVVCGYNFSCSISVKLGSNDDRLTRLYCELIQNKYMRNVYIQFITEDTDKYYDELLNKIITKANHRADVIRKASNKSTVDTLKINVGGRPQYISYNSFNYEYDECDCDFDLEADFVGTVNTRIETMANTSKELSETIDFEFVIV